ncbi:thrombospondin [Micromonospora sp. NPDC050980]|uniref:thrombospondin n=1 Tax=Micromonospora sp. NPDC050980 TaxID=3155161 RepID=UPI0033D0E985
MNILSRRKSPARSDDVNGDGVVDARDENTVADGTAGEPVLTDRDAAHTTYRSGASATEAERAADTGRTGEAGRVTDAGRVPAGDRVGGAEPVDDGHVETVPRTGEAERRAAQRAASARAATSRPEGRNTRTADPEPTREHPVDLDRDGRPDRATDLDRDPHAARTVSLDRDGHADRTVDLDGDGRPDRELDPALTKKPRASLLATLGLVVSVVGALFVLSGTLAGYGIGLGAVGAVLAVLGLNATRRRHVAGKTDALIGIAVGLAAVVLGVVAMTGQFDWPTADGEWVGRFREWLDSQFVDRF